jgi:hypothetical protein
MAQLIITLGLLKVIQLFCKLVPSVDYSSLDSYTSGFNNILNIFAWVNKFVHTGLILVLFSVTASMFMVKVFWRIIDKFISIFH